MTSSTPAVDESEQPLKGVSLDPMPGGGHKNKSSPGPVWRVRIYQNRKEMTVGRFGTLSEANAVALAYQDPVVQCEPQGRCQGCQGWRLRSAESWVTVSEGLLLD